MTGLLAGRKIGLPESLSKPSRTSSLPSSGRRLATGSSSVSVPRSPSCMAATVVIALVMEAMRKIEPAVTSTPEAASRLPREPS